MRRLGLLGQSPVFYLCIHPLKSLLYMDFLVFILCHLTSSFAPVMIITATRGRCLTINVNIVIFSEPPVETENADVTQVSLSKSETRQSH